MTARPLSRAEINLCRSVFGDAIDYDRVRVFNRKWWPFQPKHVTMAPDGNLWFHPRGGKFCDDYCTADLNLQGLFIHEMVHVWQHQQGVFLPLVRHPFCRYDYDLEPGRKFREYNVEQQAEIIRHVFLLRKGMVLKSGLTLSDFLGLVPFDPRSAALA
ncbi:MAG: vgr related protein [Pseudomonadota bacterium]